MAITKGKKRALNAVHLISRLDDAVDHEASDWDKYKADPIGNSASLITHEGKEPTRFLCNFELSSKDSARIKDCMIMKMDEDNNATPSYGKWAYMAVKLCLKGILNPPNVLDVIEFKKDGSGPVSDRTMDELERVGLVSELFGYYISLTKEDTAGSEKN